MLRVENLKFETLQIILLKMKCKKAPPTLTLSIRLTQHSSRFNIFLERCRTFPVFKILHTIFITKTPCVFSIPCLPRHLLDSRVFRILYTYKFIHWMSPFFAISIEDLLILSVRLDTKSLWFWFEWLTMYIQDFEWVD